MIRNQFSVKNYMEYTVRCRRQFHQLWTVIHKNDLGLYSQKFGRFDHILCGNLEIRALTGSQDGQSLSKTLQALGPVIRKIRILYPLPSRQPISNESQGSRLHEQLSMPLLPAYIRQTQPACYLFLVVFKSDHD
ncbi:hypothetical protein ASL14_24700 [Paenibacillus sp. IHB B 3084]|nr:hypothetical protein ASL14_24700 [Paenibacillus sp. IHB B 3084]